MRCRFSVVFVLLSSLHTATAEEVSAREWEVLKSAQTALSKASYAEVLTVIEPLTGKDRAGALARALAHQFGAEAALGLGRDAAALTHLDAAIASDALPAAQRSALYQRKGIILLSLERFAEAADTLGRVAAEQDADPTVIALAALAEARSDDCESALARLAAPSPVDREVPRTWYEVKSLCAIRLGRYQDAADSLRALIARAPRDLGYWRQLVAVYQRDERYREAVATYRAAEPLVNLDGDDLLNWAQLLVYTGNPYAGAELLAGAIADGAVPPTERHLDRLAEAWVAAREFERAAEVLRRLSTLDGGDALLRAARLAWRQADWPTAIERYRKALETLPGDERAQALLELGMVAVYGLDLELARQTFESLRGSEAHGAQAQAWLEHLEARR